MPSCNGVEMEAPLVKEMETTQEATFAHRDAETLGSKVACAERKNWLALQLRGGREKKAQLF